MDDYRVDDYHEILLRNEYFLPKKSSWMTKKQMLAIFLGNQWCPKYPNLVIRPCPKAPSKELLIEHVNKEIEKKIGKKYCLVMS